MTDSTTFDIGIRCVEVDGQWRIEGFTPGITGDLGQVGIYLDILASAIKLLALTYLVPESPEPQEK